MHTVTAKFANWVAADQAIAVLREHGFSLDQITLTEASPWGPDIYPSLTAMMDPVHTDHDGLAIDQMMVGISNPRSLDNQYGTVHEQTSPSLAGAPPVQPSCSPIITVVQTDAAHAPLASDLLREAGGVKVISTL